MFLLRIPASNLTNPLVNAKGIPDSGTEGGNTTVTTGNQAVNREMKNIKQASETLAANPNMPDEQKNALVTTIHLAQQALEIAKKLVETGFELGKVAFEVFRFNVK